MEQRYMLTRRRIDFGIAAVAATILLMGALAYHITQHIAHVVGSSVHRHEVVSVAARLMAQVQTVDSMARGGEPVEGEGGEIRALRDRLAELTAQEPGQRPLIAGLDSLLARVAGADTGGGVAPAGETGADERWAAASAELRLRLAALIRREETAFATAVREHQSGVGSARKVLLASTGLSLLLLALAGAVFKSDLARRQRAEAERAATGSSLRAAVRAAGEANRSKADFLARVSHEMRTPLNAILGMAELLRDTPLNADQSEYARTVESSAENLLNVVGDLLLSSKIEAGQMEVEVIPFSPREVIEGIAEVVAVRAEGKNLELALSLSPSLPRCVRGDPMRFRQVLMNLVGNAIKFTERGEVALRADARYTGMDQIELRVEVFDTGIGITKHDLERVFLPFVQADVSTTRRYGGTGLGLNIAQSLAQLMGGEITVESQLGRGSTFRVTLPLVVEDARPVTDGTEFRGARILLLIENRIRRDGVERLLSAAGAVTLTARDVAEASALAVREGVDAAVIDARGTDVEPVRQNGGLPGAGGTPLVLLCPFAERFADGAGPRPTNFQCVKTPVRQSRLLEVLQRAVGHEAPGAAEPAALVPAPPPPQGARCWILLAEDNAENRALVMGFLRGEGYRIDAVETGQDAIDRAREVRYDLILMDLEMPLADGYQAAREIRAMEQAEGREPTPIVALTAHPVEWIWERCLDAGMDGCATKPIRGQALRDLVDRWADTRPTVLVAEDAPDVQLMLRGFLKAEPYRLRFAADGDQALAALRRFRVSAVLLDMNLGGRSGYSVAEQIRADAELRHLPVIATTGHTGVEERQKCLRAGCSDYLPKPVRRADLVRALANALSVPAPVPACPPAPAVLAEPTAPAEAGSGVDIEDEPLLAEFAEHFLELRRSDLGRLDEWLREGRLSEIALLGHQIKGSGATFGFPGIGAIGARLEVAATTGDAAEASCLLEKLRGELEQGPRRIAAAAEGW